MQKYKVPFWTILIITVILLEVFVFGTYIPDNILLNLVIVLGITAIFAVIFQWLEKKSENK
ncbi:hypothetical protein RZN22_11000 [Bacillaceae bacterium S4-13-58]